MKFRELGCATALSLLSAYSGAANKTLVIEHVTLVSPERSSPLRDATVTIKDERIVSITSGSASSSRSAAEVFDGKGLYLAPGLIDSHVHTSEIPGMTAQQEQAYPDIAHAAREQIPRSYLFFGFTTVVDLISTSAQIAKWNSVAVHPDIYFCGAAPVMDGYPMNWSPKPQRYESFPYMLIEQGQEAAAPAGFDPAAQTPEAVVSRMKADGALCVKSFFERGFGKQQTLPVPRLETMRALVRAAHEAKMSVFLHANGSDAQAFAVEAGVDVIAHGLWHWNGESQASSELTPAMKTILDGVLKVKVGWQPTLQVLYGERDLFDAAYLSNPQLARVLPANLIGWYRTPEGQWFHDVLAKAFPPSPGAESSAGAPVANSAPPFYAVLIARNRNATGYLAKRNARFLFGTDTPSAPTYANPPGMNGRLEMQKLGEAGLTPAQIFRAATITNAEALGLNNEIGTVQIGKRANLLLLRMDPSKSIAAYDTIEKVILHGQLVDRAELAANREGPH